MPESIKIFEKLFLGALLLGVVKSAILRPVLLGPLLAWPSFQALIMLVIGTLVLLTSRKRSSICKWILVVLFVAGLIAYIPQLWVLLQQGRPGIVSIDQLAIQGFALSLLFNADSKAWFDSSPAQE